MIFELRTYHCVPGRLPDVNKRFTDVTLRMFERHGIKQVGFWTTLIGSTNQALIYMLQWESLADREQRWNALAADPEWIAARKESEKDGPLVERIENSILTPTGFSALR